MTLGSHCTACVMCWGEGTGEEPGGGPSLLPHSVADAVRAAGRFSGSAWRWNGPQRPSSLIPWPHSSGGRLPCPSPPAAWGRDCARGPGLLLPIPGLLAPLALDGKGLYQERSSRSPEGTENNRRRAGRAGCDSGSSKMPLMFLRKRCYFITLGA